MIVEQPATRWSLSPLRPTTIRLRLFSFPTSASNHPYTGGVKIQSSHFRVESSEDDSNVHLGAWKFKGVVRSRPPEGVPKVTSDQRPAPTQWANRWTECCGSDPQPRRSTRQLRFPAKPLRLQTPPAHWFQPRPDEYH